MSEIKNIIIDKIKQSAGRIPFSEFMSEALYHPTLGYYNRPEMTIGERGDFYTSPMVHSIFGHCVARQINSLWKEIGSPDSFVILEMGAGTGALAKDVLTEWDRLHTNASPPLKYIIVEQSPVLRQKQRETTSESAQERINWYSTLREIPEYGSLTGVILSNELFDALPVHRLTFKHGRLQESYVAIKTEDDSSLRLDEIIGELSDPNLASLVPEKVVVELQEGDRIEVSPLWGNVLDDMADALQAGFVLTIDYGDSAPDVYWKHVNGDGIRCFYKQALVTDPYDRIGNQDITADVDFTYLQRIGEQKGLETFWFSNQTEFLERFGFLKKVEELQRMSFKDLRADFELQKMLALYLPQGLGDACKVLIQRKK